jgi:hypothetical protein
MIGRLTGLFAISLAVLMLISCNKEEDTIAEVKVITQSGAPVAGAQVRIFAQGTVDQTQVGLIRFDRTDFTNSSGVVSFDFTEDYKRGQSGFAILNLEITKEFPDSTAFLEGIMKIVEEETNRKTFILE